MPSVGSAPRVTASGQNPAVLSLRMADQRLGAAGRAEEPDVDHRVQLDVVRRRAGHVVLLLEDPEPAAVAAPVDVVAVGGPHRVPARGSAAAGASTAIPTGGGADGARRR